ncbi:MAG: Gfo/Idh/MocA family oxidoreductase [Actinocatenispora sp.]
MSSAKLKVAVLSFAHGHALGYLRYLAGRPDVELVASDPDGAGATQPATRGPGPAAALGVRYLDTYQEALRWGPDAVVICSENARHRELVELAAPAGAHILCEKPLATSVADAEAMRAATAAAGVELMVAFPVRFAPSFVSLRARCQAGQLGTVLGIVGTNNGMLPLDAAWFVDPALSGGGSIVDHVVHCADLIDSLLGEQPTSVYAVANRTLYADTGVEVETGGLVTATYGSGVIATIDCSWSQPRTAPTWGGLSLKVVGTKGTVEIAPFAAHVGGHGPDGAVWLSYGADLDGLMIDEFLTAVRDGRRPQPDIEVGVRTTTLMTAAQASARTGQVCRIEPGH